MAITRETLVKNLEEYEARTKASDEQAWQRMMLLFDQATKRGERSVSITHGHGFSCSSMDYIKQRAVREGMRWSLQYVDSPCDDGTSFLVIEL